MLLGQAGRKAHYEFAARHSHRPSDDLNLPIDYRMAARFAEVYRRIALDIANAQSVPRWYEGDLFGNLFAPDAPKASRADRD